MAPTLTAPRNADELREMLGDPQHSAKILESHDTLTDFIVNYAEGQTAADPGLSAQVRELTQAEFGKLLKSEQIEAINRLNLSATAKVDKSRNAAYNGKALGAGLDQDFPTWAEYLPAIWPRNATQAAREAREKIASFMNALGSTVPSDGGFLIPETLRSELLAVSLESALVRRMARVVPMESLTVPFPTIDATSNASSVYGGLVGYWTEEGGSLTDSSPTFGRVNLMAKKLTVYSEIPNELFSDSISTLQTFMDRAFPEALAWFEDIAFIRGTGVGEPLGFLNAGAAVSAAAEDGQTATTIQYENLASMYSRMLPSSMNRAVWIAHIDTFPQLATMALSVGTGGSAVWIGNGNGAVGTPPATIFGRPVYFTEKVNSLGTAGDINFVDLNYYLIGDRQSMQAATSTDYQFQNDKTSMRVIQRVDGQPWIKSAITPQTGSNTLSPFVQLATRS